MRKVKIKLINGKKYAYDMKSVWDKTQKRYRKKTVYLGRVIDEEKGIYEKLNRGVSRDYGSELILDYGDSASIDRCINNSIYGRLFKSILFKHNDSVMGLICYKLIQSKAMDHAETWFRGNYASKLYPKANLSSQRISGILKALGSEKERRKFFKSYISTTISLDGTSGVMTDSTGMPNEISFSLSAGGNHGGESERETRLIMVVERSTGVPLYFRYMAGNIVDVSTLSDTIAELKEMGVDTAFALIDAGYYSESNVTELYDNNISFVTRLPAERTLYKELIKEHSADMEGVDNMVSYGRRVLYIKTVEVELFSHTAYAHIVCDIKRKADELTRGFIAAKQDAISMDEFSKNMLCRGKFIILSSEEIPKEEVMPLYDTRQYAENLFGISKNNLELPLRVHSVETFRGYLMLNFLALIVHKEYTRALGNDYSFEEAIMEMSNQKCKVYDNNIIISEPTKKAKHLASLLNMGVKKPEI
ncbi:MAG: transposase [Deferribacteraceae bacterium]|jgi:transposase|nr:transposase [Deferribacteraceae bacterium]